jgi:hypothetical protein
MVPARFRNRRAIRRERSEARPTSSPPARPSAARHGTRVGQSSGHRRPSSGLRCDWQRSGLGTESWPRAVRQGIRTKRITTNCPSTLHPTPSATLAPIAFFSAQSQLTSAQIDTRTPSKLNRLTPGPSSSFNMQATMSPVPIPIFPHSAGAQTAIAAGGAASNIGAPFLRQSSMASLATPSAQRLVRHTTAPEPRTYTPHPSRNKRKASFHELSPEVAERPSKRPKIEQTSSGTVAIHIAEGGSPQN